MQSFFGREFGMGASPIKEEINVSDIKEVDSSTFFIALNRAKKINKYGAYVTLHETYEYEKCKGVYLLYDESAGIAVEENGNIISVFSDQTHRGVLKFLIAKAVEVGGIKLDCFGSEGLKALYVRRGFIPISKTRFLREFAPSDWNYEQDGEPDILFWIYDRGRANPMIDSLNQYAWDSIPDFPSYDEAKTYRDSKL